MKRSRAAAVIASSLALPSVAARAQGTTPYKLGVTWPLTGPFAPIAGDFLKAAQIAVDDVNASGGIKGRPLQLQVEDSKGSPQEGVAAFRKLVQVDGVQAIFTIFTNVVTAQIPLADELKIPTIGPLEAPGLFTSSQYSFAHSSTWDKSLPLMAAYWKGHGIKRIYGLMFNSGMGQLQSPALKAKVAEIGGDYAESLLDPNPTSTDYRGVLERVRQANAQVIMLSGQGNALEAAVIKQARELGLITPIWSFSNSFTGKSFRDAVGAYGEGLVFGGLNLDPNLPASRDFARKYNAAVGYVPGYSQGLNYDIIKMYAYAFGKVGNNAEAIRMTIATLKGLPSVLGGTITMGSNHYSELASTSLWQVRSGAEVRLV